LMALERAGERAKQMGIPAVTTGPRKK